MTMTNKYLGSSSCNADVQRATGEQWTWELGQIDNRGILCKEHREILPFVPPSHPISEKQMKQRGW